jgi:hypothetical protein
MESRLSADAALGDALRGRGEQGSLPAGGGLPSCPEGHPSLPPAPPASLAALLPPAHPESVTGSGSVGSASGLRRGSAGGASQHSGSLHAGTPRTPLSAEYAAALQRNSQRLLEAVASSASSGLGGSAENPVPLPEQETLMLPLAAVPGLSPAERVRAHAQAAAEAAAAGELPPEAEAEGPAAPPPRRPPPAAATPPRRRVPEQRPAAVPEEPEGDHEGSGGGGGGSGAAAAAAAGGGDDAGAGAAEPHDSCSCPPFAVKATCGKRPIMEDTYALCPNICELPMQPLAAANFADKLPQRIAVQLATGEPSADAAALVPPPPAAGDGAAAGGAPPAPAGGSAAFAGALCGAGGSGAALEKLHFFGVYDGHGGIQASQHCAARLHHHLSVCLQEMAAGHLGLAPGGGPGGEGGGAVVPEVQFISMYRPPTEGGASGGPLSGADDCLIAVAAAAAAAAEAGAGKLASVSSAPDVSPEDEAALRALSRESSGAEREDDGGAPSGESEGGGDAEGDVEDGSGGDEAASADGSEGTSVCVLLEEALREAFLKTDEEFSADGTAGLVGSTAVCALVGTHRVWIANCGDSRAVLCRGGQAVQVTDDHKPEREDEAVGRGRGLGGGLPGRAVDQACLPACLPGEWLHSRALTFRRRRRPAARRSGWRRRAGRCCTGTATA